VNETQHGYLLLADISGYTSYVASTELTHSQDILSELLELIIERFKPLLTIAKIEGDAVFAYAPQTKIARGEAILELVESTYVAFRSRREAAHRRTTCTCNACRNIPSLDLKFISHHGDYFILSTTSTKLLMTFHFMQTESDKTHLFLTFRAEVPHMPEWFKKRFCKFILKTQVMKFWKLDSINDLMAADVNQ